MTASGHLRYTCTISCTLKSPNVIGCTTGEEEPTTCSIFIQTTSTHTHLNKCNSHNTQHQVSLSEPPHASHTPQCVQFRNHQAVVLRVYVPCPLAVSPKWTVLMLTWYVLPITVDEKDLEQRARKNDTPHCGSMGGRVHSTTTGPSAKAKVV